MKVVYKYPLGMGRNIISLPTGAIVVHVAMQDDFPHLWAEVKPDSESYEQRCFEVFGTGHGIPDDAKFISTFLDPPYVWHVYETL